MDREFPAYKRSKMSDERFVFVMEWGFVKESDSKKNWIPNETFTLRIKGSYPTKKLMNVKI